MSIPTGFLPVLPLKNTVVYPGVGQALRIGREKSILALNKAHENQSWILAVAQKNPDQGALAAEDLCAVGTLCKVESVRGNVETGFQAILRGHQRMRITEVTLKDQYFQAMAEPLEDVVDIDDATRSALMESLKNQSRQILRYVPSNTEQLDDMIENVEDLAFLSYLCAAHLDVSMREKQDLLENINLKSRVMALLVHMQNFKENLQVQAEIRSKVSSKLGQTQREHILREQLRTIREELGEEGQDGTAVGDKYLKRIEEAGMTEEAKKVALQEVNRLKNISPQSPEYQIIQNYLDLLTALPWSQAAHEGEIDLEKARQILDADHYGLAKIKKRILQYLAVMKLKNNNKGNILLFVGPPGVGKTSLGQSIAKALGRQYVRVSLGGVRDEAEIRGHRRTYVGALPGRIINAMKKAGENNPVFVLDEVDKLGRGFQGDPGAALLEVLDPEQNSRFNDHYLEVGYDLSNVFFIATANSLEGIPGPLMDRLEVIEVSGYTTEEKFHIAKNHLLAKQYLEHGIRQDQLEVTDAALHHVISHYTREAGVRELQRKIAGLCRWAAEKVLASNESMVVIDTKDLEEILGPERYTSEVAESAAAAGVVTGLAWTPVGGDILFIESTRMPGSGHLMITGQLGDVMKESAQIALSLLRSRLPLINPLVDFSKQDIHIHVPAGAIPKDGPSAGVTLLTSLASLFSQRKVDPKLAMTGEITLRGSVMPVGGIKEKVLAAHRAGIERVIMSKRNEKDLIEVPQEIRNSMKFIFVENVNEVLKAALELDVDLMGQVYIQPTALMQPPQQGGVTN